MELELSPVESRVFKLLWPQHGNRFTSDWTERLRKEKMRWLERTYAQSTGFNPRPVSEAWRHIPWINEAAEEMERYNRQYGIDQKFVNIDFLNFPKNDPAGEDTSIVGILGLKKTNPLAKWIVIALFIVAVILILKVIL